MRVAKYWRSRKLRYRLVRTMAGSEEAHGGSQANGAEAKAREYPAERKRVKGLA